MGLSEMYDASTPPARPPAVPVAAFYIGGDTPHVWTDEEISASPATYGLPIYVHDGVGGDASAAASQVIAWLEAHQWEKGAAVAIDTEATIEQAWIADLDAIVHAAGWPVLDYQSKGPAPSNPLTSGGRWIASWDGVAELYPGSVAKQYASAGMLGTDYDLSVIDQGVRLHQLHTAPAQQPPAGRMITVEVPELREGATGHAVRSVQVLLNEAGQSVGPAGVDGIFGPDTDAAVRRFQLARLITIDGIVGPVTWGRLVNG